MRIRVKSSVVKRLSWLCGRSRRWVADRASRGHAMGYVGDSGSDDDERGPSSPAIEVDAEASKRPSAARVRKLTKLLLELLLVSVTHEAAPRRPAPGSNAIQVDEKAKTAQGLEQDTSFMELLSKLLRASHLPRSGTTWNTIRQFFPKPSGEDEDEDEDEAPPLSATTLDTSHWRKHKNSVHLINVRLEIRQDPLLQKLLAAVAKEPALADALAFPTDLPEGASASLGDLQLGRVREILALLKPFEAATRVLASAPRARASSSAPGPSADPRTASKKRTAGGARRASRGAEPQSEPQSELPPFRDSELDCVSRPSLRQALAIVRTNASPVVARMQEESQFQDLDPEVLKAVLKRACSVVNENLVPMVPLPQPGALGPHGLALLHHLASTPGNQIRADAKRARAHAGAEGRAHEE